LLNQGLLGAKSRRAAARPKLPCAPAPARHQPPPSPVPPHPHTSPRARTRAQHRGKRGEGGKYLAESNLQKSLIGPSYQEAERTEKKKNVSSGQKSRSCYFTASPLTQQVPEWRKPPFCAAIGSGKGILPPSPNPPQNKTPIPPAFGRPTQAPRRGARLGGLGPAAGAARSCPMQQQGLLHGSRPRLIRAKGWWLGPWPTHGSQPQLIRAEGRCLGSQHPPSTPRPRHGTATSSAKPLTSAGHPFGAFIFQYALGPSSFMMLFTSRGNFGILNQIPNRKTLLIRAPRSLLLESSRS